MTGRFQVGCFAALAGGWCVGAGWRYFQEPKAAAAMEPNLATVAAMGESGGAKESLTPRPKETMGDFAQRSFAHSSSIQSVAEIARNLSPKERDEFLSAYLQALVRGGWENHGAMAKLPELAAAFPASELSDELRRALGRELVEHFPGIITSWLAGMPEKESHALIRRVGVVGLNEDTARFYLTFLAPEEWESPENPIGSVAGEHLEEALQFAVKVPESGRRHATEAAYIGHAIEEVGRGGNLESLVAACPDALRGNVFKEVALGLNGDQPEAVAHLLDLLPESERIAAEAQMINMLGNCHRNDEAALQLVRERMQTPAGEQFVPGTRDILTEYTKANPARAVQALQQFPPGPHLVPLTDAVVQQWATFDPESASTWAAALPAGDQRDAANRALALTADDTAEEALGRIGTMQNPDILAEAVKQLAKNWGGAAPLLDGVESAEMPEQGRERIRQILANVKAP